MTKHSTADDVLTPRVLREYALVADGERGALIGPDGSVAWLCAPRWDSPAAFSGLLGGAAQARLAPGDQRHPRAAPPEKLRRRPADACARPGDNDGPPGQVCLGWFAHGKAPPSCRLPMWSAPPSSFLPDGSSNRHADAPLRK